MKVEIHASGNLHIHSESQLEAYALRKWCEENPPHEHILVDTSFPVDWAERAKMKEIVENENRK